MIVALAQARLHTRVVIGQGPAAAALWQRLRRAFPWTVAAGLRTRSLVWLGRAPSIDRARQTMEQVWSPLRRRLGWPRLQLEVREVAPHKVGEVSRRVHGLGGEPLPGWSTARDLLGGVVDPWLRPRVHRELTWGRGAHWQPIELPGRPVPRAWLEPARAALRAPWLDATAPTVSGLVRGVRARVRGEADGPVPTAWVDAALRCALDPRLRGFPQPPAPGGRRGRLDGLRPPRSGPVEDWR